MKKVPSLRFHEFVGEWESKKLGDLTKINQGLQIAISERLIEKVENSYFYITNEFLREGTKSKYFIKNPPESVLCNEDDILMTRTGNTGQVVTNVSGAFHNNFFKIKHNEKIIRLFLFYFLTSYKIQCEILKLAGTSTIPDLNHSDFYKIKICFPSTKEQQKIADFLSQIDRKIELLTQKKQGLERYKKGVMQQIFSQQLRFKDDDGQDFPEWEEKNLGEIATFIKRKLTENKEVPVMTISAGKGFLNQEERFSKVIAGSSLDNYTYLKQGELSYNRGSSKTAKFGCIYMMRNSEALIPYVYHSFKLNNQNISLFFEYISSLGVLNKQLKKIISSTARMDGLLNIGQTDFFKIKLEIPCLGEQTKIANFLTVLDDKIALVSKQLDGTKQYKKGLLQQLFV